MSAHAIELRAPSALPCLQQALAHPRHYALGLGGPGLRPRGADSGVSATVSSIRSLSSSSADHEEVVGAIALARDPRGAFRLLIQI